MLEYEVKLYKSKFQKIKIKCFTNLMKKIFLKHFFYESLKKKKFLRIFFLNFLKNFFFEFLFLKFF